MSAICFYTGCDLRLFCMFEKVQRIIFHHMWELCQVPESISTVLLKCSSIGLFLDSLWRLEWQGGVITQTVWPAKPKMFTIWPVTEKLDDPLSKWIVIDLSLAFPGPSPAGRGLLAGFWKDCAFFLKGWHLTSCFRSWIGKWNMEARASILQLWGDEYKSWSQHLRLQFLIKLLSSWTKALTCLLPDFLLPENSHPHLEGSLHRAFRR